MTLPASNRIQRSELSKKPKRGLHYKPEIVTAFFKSEGLPAPVFEYTHIPGRKFRLDIAWVKERIYIEVCGGLWMPISGHKSGVGIRRDYDKMNLSAIHGWIGLHVEPKDICTLETVSSIKVLFSIKRLATDTP